MNEAPPTGLSYSQSAPSYPVCLTISNNIPSHQGGAVTSYSVSPGLPAGLTLDTSSGVISGSPYTLTAATALTVTATGPGGSTKTSLRITVIDKGPPNPSPDRITLIPPGPVASTIGKFEARAAYQNNGASPLNVRAILSLAAPDGSDSAFAQIDTTTTGGPIQSGKVRLFSGGVSSSMGPTVLAQHPGQDRVNVRFYDLDHGNVLLEERSTPLEVRAYDPSLFPTGYIPSSLPYSQVAWLDALALSPGIFARQDPTSADPGAVVMNARFVCETLHQWHQLGMDTIIVTYVEYQNFYFYHSQYPFLDADVSTYNSKNGLPWPVSTVFWTDSVAFNNPSVHTENFDLLNVVFTVAEQQGQKVVLGLGRSGDTPLINDLYATYLNEYFGIGSPVALDILGRDINKRLSDALFYSEHRADELVSGFGNYKSFYGFYVTHEFAPFELAAARNFLEPLADHLRQIAPDKVIMAAPVGSIVDPQLLSAISQSQQEANYTAQLTNAPYDIGLYQDSVGAGLSTLGQTTGTLTFDPALRMGQLPGYYSKLRTLHAAADAGRTSLFHHFWTDTEIWRSSGGPSCLRYGNPFPASFFDSTPQSPLPGNCEHTGNQDGVKTQLALELQYADYISFYEPLGTMQLSTTLKIVNETINTFTDYSQRARKLYLDYQSYLTGCGKMCGSFAP